MEAEGSVELVEIDSFVPGLKFKPGLSKWKVAAKEKNVFYESYEDVPEQHHSLIRPYMFPPKTEEEAKKHQLNRYLMRFY